MQGKCRLWFNFNNLIDLLKPTGLSKPIRGSLLCRPAERLDPTAMCVVRLQPSSLPRAETQETIKSSIFQNISHLRFLFAHSAALGNMALFFRVTCFLFTLQKILQYKYELICKNVLESRCNWLLLLELMNISF